MISLKHKWIKLFCAHRPYRLLLCMISSHHFPFQVCQFSETIWRWLVNRGKWLKNANLWPQITFECKFLSNEIKRRPISVLFSSTDGILMPFFLSMWMVTCTRSLILAASLSAIQKAGKWPCVGNCLGSHQNTFKFRKWFCMIYLFKPKKKLTQVAACLKPIDRW